MSKTTTRSPDRELAVLQAIGRALPPIPHITGVVNRGLKPFYLRRHREAVLATPLGIKMRLDPHEAIDGAYLFYPHLYDRAEIRFLQSALRPGDAFVDVGAHIGFYSLNAARAVGPSGVVLAIEPEPVNHERLRWNLDANDARQVRTVNVGVSSVDEERVLAVNTSGNRGGTAFTSASSGTGLVRCRPLLDILADEHIEQVTGMKLDIEGDEPAVLERFLSDADPRLRPRWMILEAQGSADPESDRVLLELLSRHGYRVRSRHFSNAENWIVER